MHINNDLDVQLLGTKESRRGPRHFRKTRSAWGVVETDFGPLGYESSLEQSFLFMMVADPQTTSITHQPIQINFMIAGKATKRRYTPDYMVDRDINKPWVWGEAHPEFANILLAEIKPLSKLTSANRSAIERHEAARKWAIQNNTEFQIITERFVEPISVSNARNVIAASEARFPGWVLRKPVLTQPMRILDIFEACTDNADHNMVPHFLYLGFARRWFWCPLNVRLSLTTIVYPP